MIEYAILGLLSWKPLSGYDLKKLISDSSIFYWSGNNNQIYRSLVQLHDQGLVDQEVHLQESLPARKVYTITEKGLAALREWVVTTPELPEVHNLFAIHLAWADLLTDEELDELLGRYEAEVEVRLRMEQEQARGREPSPDRTPREAFLWQKIGEHSVGVVQHELDWVREVRAGLKKIKQGAADELSAGHKS